MLDLEAEGRLVRRAHSSIGATYADCADDHIRLYNVTKQLFIRGSSRPRTLPPEDAIQAYEDGADPAEIFDADTRLFIAKVELLRTGRYFRRLTNDIRGRGVSLHGVPATYADEDDEFGWFDVLSAPWPWPTLAETGEPLVRFGLSDQTCRNVGARLLRELRKNADPTGGRAHKRETQRLLRDFGTRFAMPWEPDARYDDEPTEFNIEARQNNSGKENFIVLFRRASHGQGGRRGSRRGLSWFGPGTTKCEHIAATGCLRELTASVGHHLEQALFSLEAGQLATVHDAVQASRPLDEARSLRAKAKELGNKVSTARDEARGLRMMAARKAAAGDLDSADNYDQQAFARDEAGKSLEAELAEVEGRVAGAATRTVQGGVQEDHVDLTVGAYLAAGLRRATATGGRASDRLARLADETLTGWSLRVVRDELQWDCVAMFPLRSGGQLALPLAGTIRNVRTRTGKTLATPEITARYVLAEGRELDAVAELLEVTRKTLPTQRVMPWLVAKDMSSRGAKNALVDHPIPAVRRIVHASLTGHDSSAADAWPNAVADHVRSTYRNPALQWGDAACPDDIHPQMRLAATLAAQQHDRGIGVQEAALTLGVTERIVRNWVSPEPRCAGFQRPRYVEYVPGTGNARVRLIACPHLRCRGRADHVCLLPEVAVSGLGVLCTECFRVPLAESPWPGLRFPDPYFDSYNASGAQVGLRDAQQTVRVAQAVPMAVTRTRRRAS